MNDTKEGKAEITFHEHVQKTLNSASQMTTAQQKDTHSASQVTQERKGKPGGLLTIATNLYTSLIGRKDDVTELSKDARTVSEQSNEMSVRDYRTVHKSMESSIHTTDPKHSVVRTTTCTTVNLTGLQGSVSVDGLIKAELLDKDVLRRLEMGLTTVEVEVAQFLSQPKTIAGVYLESSKKNISFLEAAKNGILAHANAIEFLEAQAATSGSISLAAGSPQLFEDALGEGSLDTLLKGKLREAHLAFSGYIHGDKKLSVFEAMEARLVDRCNGNAFLEVQLATGGLVNPELGVRVPVDIAVDRGLLTKAALQSLYEPLTNPKRFHNPCTGQKAHYGELLNTCVYDVDDSVYLLPFPDMDLSNASPTSARKGSVISSLRGTEMSAYEAYKGNHINKRTYLFLSRQGGEWVEEASVDADGSVRHIITDGKSGRRLCIETAISQRFLETTELASYRSGSLSIYELVDLIYSRMVVVEDVNSPVAGLWDATQRKLLSVLQAFQENLIDGVTALRLLEAQVCTGGILDPTSGEKATLKQALSRGLVGGSFAGQLSLYEQAYHGIVQPKTGKKISVAQAIQENLFPKDIGMRCLEFQLLTGGLINPETQSRISLEEVTQSGLLDKSRLALLKDAKSYSKIIICPKTRRCISYKEALERSIHDHHTGLRLLEAVRAKPTRQSYWNYH